MIILNDGTYYEPDDEQIIYWQNAFPQVDIFAELSAMAAGSDASLLNTSTAAEPLLFVDVGCCGVM